LKGYRKTQGNRVVEIGGRMSRIEVAGDICLRSPRPTQGWRTDDDHDDDGDDYDDIFQNVGVIFSYHKSNV